jgi:hypothetical protein
VDLLLIVAAFAALAILSLAFGADSRDGLTGDEAARWDTWRWAAAERRGRLARSIVSPHLDFDVHTRPAEALAFAASTRLGASRAAPRRSPLRPAFALLASRLGNLLVAAGQRLQTLAAPHEIPAGGSV